MHGRKAISSWFFHCLCPGMSCEVTVPHQHPARKVTYHPRLNPRFPKSDTAILDTLPLWHSAMLTHCHAMSSCFWLWSSLRRSVTWKGVAEPTSKDSFLVKSSDLVCWETPSACRTPVSVFNPWDARWGKTSYQSEKMWQMQRQFWPR